MTRPFPWKCRVCGEQKLKPVVVDYFTEMEHDGRLYSFTTPNLEILECESCRSRVLPDAAMEAILNQLRMEAGLLAPAEIRAKRKAHGLTQEQLANYLKVAKETVSRWETGGQIQQRAMDLLLRLFFDLPQVRSRLGAPGGQNIFTTGVQSNFTTGVQSNFSIAGNLTVNSPELSQIDVYFQLANYRPSLLEKVPQPVRPQLARKY